ncbi:MAG TPA: ECF-type sigma factor [Gemmata sp.]|jgi:RNA polymerase sigma factor (TIGR02999 family)|nr:ECF-type sigma factor [Gemmata sp.]
MTDATHLLNAIEQGDPQAAAQLLPLVYDELRRLASAQLANERPGQTLNATALVHEAYLRLVGHSREQEKEIRWESRGHFFTAAAEAMRRILIEAARRKLRLRHGGDRQRIPLEGVEATADIPDDDLLALDEALKALATTAPLKPRLVELRFFAGLTVEDAARCLGISRATADRWWSYARVWLFDFLQTGKKPKKA